MTSTFKLLLTGLALAPAPAFAQAVGVNLGTPGIGVEAQAQVAPGFVLRGGYDYLRFDRDKTYSGVPTTAS